MANKDSGSFVPLMTLRTKLNMTYIEEDGSFNLPKQYEGKILGLSNNEKTIFPCASALASSFDKNLIKEVYTIKLKEAWNDKKSVFVLPSVAIKRDPYAGMSFDLFSEDSYLNHYYLNPIIEVANKLKMATLMKGFLKEDLEYAKYNISSNIDMKNLYENYLNPLSILDEIPNIIELPSNEINHKLIHEAPGLIDNYKKTLGIDTMLIPEKNSYSFKGDLLENGVDLSYRDDLFMYHQLQEQNYFDEIDKYANRIVKFADKYAIDLNKWREYPIYQEHKLSVFATANSNVLLKNENHILPLKYESILLLGKAQDHPLAKGLYAEINSIKQPSIEALMKNYSKDVRYIELYNSMTSAKA